MSEEPAERPDPVDPDLIDRPDVRVLLAAHDIGAFYRVLGDNGWSQRRIAKATGVRQSQISEILKGRWVIVTDSAAVLRPRDVVVALPSDGARRELDTTDVR